MEKLRCNMGTVLERSRLVDDDLTSSMNPIGKDAFQNLYGKEIITESGSSLNNPPSK